MKEMIIEKQYVSTIYHTPKSQAKKSIINLGLASHITYNQKRNASSKKYLHILRIKEQNQQRAINQNQTKRHLNIKLSKVVKRLNKVVKPESFKQIQNQNNILQFKSQYNSLQNIKRQKNFKILIQSVPEMIKLKKNDDEGEIQKIACCLHSTLRKSLFEKVYKSHNFIGKDTIKANIKDKLIKSKFIYPYHKKSQKDQNKQSSILIEQKKSIFLMNQIMKKSQKQVLQNIKKESFEQKGQKLKNMKNHYESILKKEKKEKFYKLRKLRKDTQHIKKDHSQQQEQKLQKKLSLGAQQSQAKNIIQSYSQQFIRSDQDKNNKLIVQTEKKGIHSLQARMLQQLQISEINAWQSNSSTRYQKFYW